MVSAHKRHDSFVLICVHLRLKPYLGSMVSPTAWIPAFAGMTKFGVSVRFQLPAKTDQEDSFFLSSSSTCAGLALPCSPKSLSEVTNTALRSLDLPDGIKTSTSPPV